MKAINFLVVGVGGQGALLASNVLAEVGVRAGYDVKKAEVHGMSQRGGSVNSHVRWGQDVKSPVIGEGEVDVLFSLEKLETLRYVSMLRRGGAVLVGEFVIPPLTVSSGDDDYPDDAAIAGVFSQVTERFDFVPTLGLAKAAGSSRAHNVVLLGALSVIIDAVPLEIWLQVIAERVPKKYVQVNQKAFRLGKEIVSKDD
ncbi:MAG: indolepyruvate oxidoreductase subunit beta [Chloroflexota bacterium]|nr:indolepyruvate oxidoreductase subunit beta [Chloroflexota bacterium]